ncbi:hypothetical protein [Actinomadura sp. 7K507]|uniref:hypothetical protein n=1 Tax=Actinomadura sp. 7K507 TaxID=2530365 RepID=UPI001045CA02|nr:hypothetical protein [Actinomadura sp. 7K507]
MFKAAVALLGLSAVAYGFVEYSGDGQSGALAEATDAPVVSIFYGAIVLWGVVGGRSARAATPWLVPVLAIGQIFWAQSAEGLAVYVVALVASVLGVVLLYRPQCDSYFAAKESRIAAAQVRRLFEERGRDGERLHTVSGIAAILGMSSTAVYRYLDADQRRQVHRPPDDL